MKICICASGSDLDSQISPAFGRCAYFLIINSETEKFKVVPNEAVHAGRGVGVSAAQVVSSEKVEAVICGNFGPNAFLVLQNSGIKIYPGVFGLTVREALDKYNKEELKEIEKSTTPGRFGLGRGRGFSGRGR